MLRPANRVAHAVCRARCSAESCATRRRLLTAHERLRPETFARMWNELLDADEVGV